ncbi:hypothetical protein [Streptomyces cacaoi]|uniref:hypothetical protein n=1 Tax=Streptomyces cacaoi TaxID=1898 RepID=UPI003747D089
MPKSPSETAHAAPTTGGATSSSDERPSPTTDIAPTGPAGPRSARPTQPSSVGAVPDPA